MRKKSNQTNQDDIESMDKKDDSETPELKNQLVNNLDKDFLPANLVQILDNAILHVLSRMQIYTEEKHKKIMKRAEDTILSKSPMTHENMNIFGITPLEFEVGLRNLLNYPMAATQATLHFNLRCDLIRHGDLVRELGFCILILSYI